jgi:hypothetical protein
MNWQIKEDGYDLPLRRCSNNDLPISQTAG